MLQFIEKNFLRGEMTKWGQKLTQRSKREREKSYAILKVNALKNGVQHQRAKKGRKKLRNRPASGEYIIHIVDL